MLSIKTWKSSESAISYYTHEQANIEYYAGDKRDSGYFQGLQSLGVSDQTVVTKDRLEKLMQGFSFEGSPLVQRAGNGHRSGYDLTFSAPKSVSILWALGSQDVKESVLKAHQNAVNEALLHMEKYAGITRRGKNGHRLERVKNLMFAKFEHGTSRENDPQLHTHCLLFNVAPRQDGGFGTIESRYIYEEVMAAGAIYQGQLAYNLETELGCNSDRKNNSFEIFGVPNSLIDRFSTRRNQIKLNMKLVGYSSPKSADISALKTRKNKENIPIPQLEIQWKSRSKEFKEEQIIGREKVLKESIEIETFLESMTDHQSTFSKRDLRKSLALKAQTITNRQGFEKLLAQVMTSDDLILLGNDQNSVARFTTKDMYKLEQCMLNTILSTDKSEYFQVKKKKVLEAIEGYESSKSRETGKKIRLTDEQKQVVLGIATDPGSTKIALGIAGSGKSFSLEIAKQIWEKEGFSVVGMAPTGKASLGLQGSTGIKSSTIDSFLIQQNTENPSKKIHRNTILVVDEAGMIGSKKLSKLVELSSRVGAKIVFAGDTRQLQPVEAGSAIKMIERKIGSVGLQKIYRQEQDWQKNATQFFADGEATKALTEYKKHGLAEVFSTPEAAHSALISDYLKDKQKNFNDSRVILAETNHQVQALNIGIKQKLYDSGKTNSGHEIQIKSKGKELETRHFSTGERILFTKNSRKLGVTNGSLGDILETKKTKTRGVKFTVKLDSGKTVSFNSKDYKNLENGFAVTIHKAQGDTLDRSFFLLSEKTSREAAYVAMSRHREEAKIYIDRSSFSELIDWKKVENESKNISKTAEIESKTIALVGRKASKSQQKDTSLDYKKSHSLGISR